MLTLRAYTLRQKSRLAVSLSWIAGYTNVVTLIYCGVMSSHVTGNATHFGQVVAELSDRPSQAASLMGLRFWLFLLASFVAGAVISGIMMQTARRHQVRSQYILPIALEGVLLLALSIGILGTRDGAMSTQMVYFICGLTCCAMGLQNATITHVSGSVVRTTHLTGVLTDLGTDVVSLVIWFRDKTRRRGVQRWRRAILSLRRHATAHRVVMLFSIAGSFMFGVVVGALVTEHLPVVGLIPPVLFLLWIVWIDYYQPIADVKLLDLVADPELKSHGIEKSMLPTELVIYRISPKLADTPHQAPNFSAWADDLPRECRAAILSLGNTVHLDGDAALDLQAAIQKMKDHSRHLIMAGM